MAADNALFVVEVNAGFAVAHGSFSSVPYSIPADEQARLDCFGTKEEALAFAHESAKDYEFLQYGIIDLTAQPRLN